MSLHELARRHGGCGEIVNAAAWSDGDAVPSTAGLCDSPEKHRAHAAEPTGGTGAPGGDELREQVANVRNGAGETIGGTAADAVLALPAVRDALAAQETVTAIRELHTRDATEPHACDYCGQAWPCDVIHALDTRGEPS